MSEHPQHPYSPITDREGFPSVAHLESIGAQWRNATDQYLIGFSLQSGGTDAANQTPSVLEMQRRLKASIETFTTQAAAHAGEQIEQQHQHTAAIRAFDESSGRTAAAASSQTAEVVNLTRRLKVLTVVLTWLTVFQVIFGGIQAVAILLRWFGRGTP